LGAMLALRCRSLALGSFSLAWLAAMLGCSASPPGDSQTSAGGGGHSSGTGGIAGAAGSPAGTGGSAGSGFGGFGGALTASSTGGGSSCTETPPNMAGDNVVFSPEFAGLYKV